MSRTTSSVAFTGLNDATMINAAVKGDTNFFRRLFKNEVEAGCGEDCAARLCSTSSSGGGGQRRSGVLHYSASHGHIALTALLLAHGADPNAVNNLGSTPLHFAVFHGYKEVAELLLRQGAAASVGRSGRFRPLRRA